MHHSVYIFSDRIAVCGVTHPHPEHRHAFIQVFVSKCPEMNYLDVQIIPSNCPHGLSSNGAFYFSLLLDPSSKYGTRLRTRYSQNTDSPIIQLQLPETDFPLAETARIAALSESRFLAVFKQQTGVPFRNYLLMHKLVRGIHLLEKSGSFTEAAHAAGFADAAHFTRTVTHSTGMNLRDIFRNSQFIQVYYDLSI